MIRMLDRFLLLTPFLIAASGCGGANAEAKTVSPDAPSFANGPRAPARSPLSVLMGGGSGGSGSSGGTRSELAEDIALDASPSVQAAVFNTRAMLRSERELTEHYSKALRPKLDQARLGRDWESHNAALATFQKAARTLREMGEDVVRADDTFRALAERHKKDLSRAPQSYRNAAAFWREKSAEATEKVFQDSYARLAENAEVLAALIEERSASFSKFVNDVMEATKFTRKTVDFLREFELCANLAPALDVAQFRAQYRDYLSIYVRSFGDFLALHESWTASLRAQPLPARPTEQAPKPSAPSPSGGPHFVAYRVPSSSAPVSTDEAAIGHAAQAGISFEATTRDLLSQLPGLRERLKPYTGLEPPAALRTELARYVERAGHVNSITRLSIVAADRAYVTSRLPLAPGRYLPIVSLSGHNYLGVVRVGDHLGEDRYEITLVRGDSLRSGDTVLGLP